MISSKWRWFNLAEGIGSRLKKLLDIKGMNVVELSRLSGVSKNTIYSIIRRDSTKADLDDLASIAEVLGVTLDYFADQKKAIGDAVPELSNSPLSLQRLRAKANFSVEEAV